MTRTKIVLPILLLISAVGVGAWQATSLHVWWTLRQLRNAGPEERAARAEQLANLGEAGVGALLESWRSEDGKMCRAAEAALRVLGTVDESAMMRIVEAVRIRFPDFNLDGKSAALRWSATIASRDAGLPIAVGAAFEELIVVVEQTPELRPALLALAGPLVRRPPNANWPGRGRELALTSLADTGAETRIAAVRVLLEEPFREDPAVLVRLLPLLRDTDATVRRHALLAVGPEREAASDDQLLPLLHDDSQDVRQLCEKMLRSRGLTEEHVRLARLVSASDPSIRLQVLPLLRRNGDLDPEVWLRRLTFDNAAAVRAAAARASGSVIGMRDRLREMAQTDPSETVRDIARFYHERSTVRRAGTN